MKETKNSHKTSTKFLRNSSVSIPDAPVNVILYLLRILLMFQLFWNVCRKSLKQNSLLTLIASSFSSFISHFCKCLQIADTSPVWSKYPLISVFSSIILTDFSSSLLSGCLSKKSLFLFSKHKSACSSIVLTLNRLLQIGQSEADSGGDAGGVFFCNH